MKRLRALHWTAERWQAAVEFVERGHVPRELSASQAKRFKRQMRWFEVQKTSAGAKHLLLVDADSSTTTRRVIHPRCRRCWRAPGATQKPTGFVA